MLVTLQQHAVGPNTTLVNLTGQTLTTGERDTFESEGFTFLARSDLGELENLAGRVTNKWVST